MADLGSDFSGILDIDAAWSTVSGRRCLAEALCRRFTTTAGTLIGDPDYGYDLRALVNAAIPSIAKLEQRIADECVKDERVRSASATVTLVAGTLNVHIAIVTRDDAERFEFTLTVTDLTVELLLLAA